MDEEQRRLKRYKLMFARFNWMEQRYHTWMNYYSLFNGALLVAYCTILVSTGKIVEVEGNISNNGLTNLGAKLFYLNCTYWDILAIIAILGVIASYCWYLSMIGHRSWLKNWREILKKEGNMPFEHILYAKTNNTQKHLIHFHSTYKITIGFIVFVLLAWILIVGYSLLNHDLSLCLFLGSLCIWAAFLFLEYTLHHFIGSDVSSFKANIDNSKDSDNKINGNQYCTLRIGLAILLFYIGGEIWWCILKQNHSEIQYQTDFNVQEVNENVEIKNDSIA